MREARVAFTTDTEEALAAEHPEIIGDLREAFLAAPSDALVERHVADILVLYEATRFLAIDARRKRRFVAMGATVGLGAMLAGAGAAAATGNLPTGLQGVVAGAVEPFGIDLPDGQADVSVTEEPSSSDVDPADAGEGPRADQPGTTGTSAVDGEDRSGSDTGPGRSETALGHSDSENNKPEVPPGLVDNPGNAPDVPPSTTPERPSAPGKSGGRAQPVPEASSPTVPPREGAAPGNPQ